MKIEGTVPLQKVMVTTAITNSAAAIRVFQNKYPKARIETIDGILVRGICSCGNPVLDGDQGYAYDWVAATYKCNTCVSQEREPT